LENQSLLQRIAALQRTECDLLKENQDWARKCGSMKKHHAARNHQWKDDTTALERRIRDLEAQNKQQYEQIQQMERSKLKYAISTLSNEDITSWLTARNTARHNWVQEFGHSDPARIRSGLHPAQLFEVCQAVRGFVRQKEDGALPDELVGSSGEEKQSATQLLLLGMLNNFIVSETLESPFWVFSAISHGAIELDSPCANYTNSMSPVGFRMDLAPWSNAAPLRSSRFPVHTGTKMQLHPISARHPPLLVTSMRSPGLVGASLSGVGQSLPKKQEMENFLDFLRQGKHSWHLTSETSSTPADISCSEKQFHRCRSLARPPDGHSLQRGYGPQLGKAGRRQPSLDRHKTQLRPKA